MDSLRIHDLDVHGYHGVYPEEREGGQLFRGNIELCLPLRAAGVSDDLEATVNYVQVIELAQAIIGGEPRQTIEAVAEELAAQLLVRFPRVDAVEISLTKLKPPVDAVFKGVTATLRRERQP